MTRTPTQDSSCKWRLTGSVRSRIESLEKIVTTRRRSSDWERTRAELLEQMDRTIGGDEVGPTPRWTPLRKHAEQRRYWSEQRRFKACHSGRRSGKTEIAKRKLVARAIESPGRYVAGAPVQHQAMKIWWQDLKDLAPKIAVADVREKGEIWFVNGSKIEVLGLDVPERVEGPPLNGIVLDEFANMLSRVWGFHVRPALADTGGWAWFIGVPEGRNHFYELVEEARTNPEWGVYHWNSEDVLPAEEIEALRKSLDEATYNQELRGSFVTILGRVYYAFDRETHARERLFYNPNRALILMFDFNVEPGICVYAQEQSYRGSDQKVAEEFTAVIGEVWIPRNSNTPTVCRKIVADWGERHAGDVLVYGDPAGGARSTKSQQGSDYDIIREHLLPVFGERLHMRVKRCAPKERIRVNAVNGRLTSMDGTKSILFDPVNAKHTINDFEAVVIKEGSDGEIDKSDLKLTHLSDATGYYVEAKHPLRSVGATSVEEIVL